MENPAWLRQILPEVCSPKKSLPERKEPTAELEHCLFTELTALHRNSWQNEIGKLNDYSLTDVAKLLPQSTSALLDLLAEMSDLNDNSIKSLMANLEVCQLFSQSTLYPGGRGLGSPSKVNHQPLDHEYAVPKALNTLYRLMWTIPSPKSQLLTPILALFYQVSSPFLPNETLKMVVNVLLGTGHEKKFTMKRSKKFFITY